MKDEVVLRLNTSEDQAALLLEMLMEQARRLPSALPERTGWLRLARQVADSLAGIAVEVRDGRSL